MKTQLIKSLTVLFASAVIGFMAVSLEAQSQVERVDTQNGASSSTSTAAQQPVMPQSGDSGGGGCCG